jgi:hypothetical protein
MQSYARCFLDGPTEQITPIPGFSAIVIEDHIEILLAEAPALELFP